MHDEYKPKPRPNPQPSASDSPAWNSGYFSYDNPAKPREPAPAVTREALTGQGAPVRPSTPPVSPYQQRPGSGSTGGYGGSYVPRTGTQERVAIPDRRDFGIRDHQPTQRVPVQAIMDQPSTAPPKRSGGVVRAIFLLIACVLLGGGAAYFVSQRVIADWEAAWEESLDAAWEEAREAFLYTQVTPEPSPSPSPEPVPSPSPTAPVRPGNVLSPEVIYELGRQPVVGITTEITTTNAHGQATTGRVTGSGFIISTDGYILTNYHVIEGATRIWVMLDDYSVHEAEFIGGEGVTSDMAVLRIDPSDLSLTAAAIGNSSEMRVGSPIYAIGNPLGELTFTMTSGIVSALNREVAVDQGQTLSMFQIDAPVNSGNSGGPVYNEFGEVVGIVTAKAVLEGVEGIGFAIPIDDAMHYATLIIERGYIPRAHLGISPVTVSEAQAYEHNLVAGVFVNSVYPDTAAEAGGIRAGDVITAIDGRAIRTVEDLRALLGAYLPGDAVIITVFREGEHLDLTITLGGRPTEAPES